MGFPKGKTSIIVIHGVGQQIPFETLDKFSRGLKGQLELKISKKTHKIKMEHRVAPRMDSRGTHWLESFVRLYATSSKNTSKRNPRDRIDIHEYYWSYMVKEAIKPSEVIHWAYIIMKSVKKYYKKNQSVLKHFESKHKDDFIKSIQFLLIFIWIYRYFRYFSAPSLRLIRFPLFKSIWEYMKRHLINPILVNYIGDVAIYTNTDMLSSHFELRQSILRGNITFTKSILKKDDDQVILVGHSLGSSVAYDTLNNLNLEKNSIENNNDSNDKEEDISIEKIKGLVTFGSPLDKTVLYFQQRIDDENYVHKKIIEHLHSFRLSEFNKFINKNVNNELVNIASKVSYLKQVKWVNYYIPKDPIGSYLRFYDKVENKELDDPSYRMGIAHTKYWEDKNLYKHFINNYLK